ncbi:Sodium/calcium exchanger protein-domain-containing protein [Microdochium trichocladiopsis]|uniref:Sodium/calcium exchanger protein-domain-containing protein n=1 Tax=Microdochium trichocladiopsis TaxID=1682393 RepID=A0A9P9BSL9_9PEZI|nr:Sodium/calcium exchanger protein-domain-containing protein [Microdochium trichocladiopsis]KAH7034724.1 Sodium/calcium exchanger protein-domain-containing protein [Microdochium trichocladiopsis]
MGADSPTQAADSSIPEANAHGNLDPTSTAAGSPPAAPLSSSAIPAGNNPRPASLGSNRRNAANHPSSTSSDDALGNAVHSEKAPASASPNGNGAALQASQPAGSGAVVEPIFDPAGQKPNVAVRFFLVSKKIIFHSWINVFLVFVPVGIAVAEIPGMPPGAIFGVNAVAIVPLAALLSHATESVARKMGDTVGALLNVTFGNAVELIIFIIALTKNEIRIVQASLLGSILANLLLILGMAFFLGGLRFREQIYNSTVTQMSACLLSLSVISLLLPTAFHASFADSKVADEQSLIVSRGTSIILLIVYIVYLLFQLKSHAYMYESTPQHIIDAESTPGPAAAWMDTSSSESSSSSDSDSDGSSHSSNTMTRRVKRAIRRRRRKSSFASADSMETGSIATASTSPTVEAKNRLDDDDIFDGTTEEAQSSRRHRHHRHKRSKGKHHKKGRKTIPEEDATLSGENIAGVGPSAITGSIVADGETRRVDFAEMGNVATDASAEAPAVGARRPFAGMRAISSIRPMASSFAPPVFSQPTHSSTMPEPTGPVPRVRMGIRRTNSLPDRLNQQYLRPPGAMLPNRATIDMVSGPTTTTEGEEDMSQKAAVVMLLISTALVAVCAEFMVGAIEGVVETSNISELFIGLIILPIVGNAAEHVTAVMVAMKNKMDLAIGVAVGSSIQIALFLTPLMVILGWIINKPMTLYFTLFETVCLFVSAFIINFLILDGRSNYLEGALLCSTYIIIAIMSFCYPDENNTSELGGNSNIEHVRRSAFMTATNVGSALFGRM